MFIFVRLAPDEHPNLQGRSRQTSWRDPDERSPAMHVSIAVVVLLGLAVAVIVGLLAAYAAARLARADGASYPAALTRAAVAFASTLTLLAILTTALASLLA
ncbi:hypothetical protein [Streptomyces sp. 7N604]|uniref:hypothetical protein n=1 Tax=Streptomyces sp. 7N604 TaxID=3457415 RepID=UPI003FD154F6